MPLQRWALAIEGSYKQMDLSHPVWSGGPVSSRLPGISRPNAQIIQWQSPADEPLAAGKSLSDFEIISDVAPGFVLAAFFGKPSIPELTADAWASLPPSVAEKLRQCLATAWDSQPRQIIGPRFSTDGRRDFVQENFIEGLRSQRYAHTIPADSAVANQLESLLRESLSTSGTRVSGAQIEDAAKSATAREREIISALALTLDCVKVGK